MTVPINSTLLLMNTSFSFQPNYDQPYSLDKTLSLLYLFLIKRLFIKTLSLLYRIYQFVAPYIQPKKEHAQMHLSHHSFVKCSCVYYLECVYQTLLILFYMKLFSFSFHIFLPSHIRVNNYKFNILMHEEGIIDNAFRVHNNFSLLYIYIYIYFFFFYI